MENSGINFKPWKHSYSPRKILAIRFQALGDTIITLAYLLDLKRNHPTVELHFLTRKEVCAIPKHIGVFDNVIAIGGGRHVELQFVFLLIRLPYLWWQGYDVVLDLQNNTLSRFVRKLLMARAWTAFDKYSDHSAGDRTRNTIQVLGLWNVQLNTKFEFRSDIYPMLRSNGWKEGSSIVVLNPAGAFPSRNWPLDYYIDFAKRWLKEIDSNTQFVLLLLPSLKEKALYLSNALGRSCIDLTGKANQVEAFAVLQKCSFVLSEDSGLMHMSWVQGVPTLALFSASKKIWSAPQGEWSLCLDSSDMECGPCGLFVCKFGDNRCLTRYQPEFVLKKAQHLLQHLKMTT